MPTDTVALALAGAAFRIGHWPQDAGRSYGYHCFRCSRLSSTAPG
jgi:hypothetical protein